MRKKNPCTLSRGHKGECWSPHGRVQSCSQSGDVKREFGAPPHDERVLAVVLVVTGSHPEPSVEKWSGEPNSARTGAFWQDMGREPLGLERTPEASESDECVQRVCPTCDRARCVCFAGSDFGVPECGRVLVGQGGATWDPVCTQPEGHKGRCAPTLLKLPDDREFVPVGDTKRRPETKVVDPFGALKPKRTFQRIGGRLIVPIIPAGHLAMSVENDTAVIERRLYGRDEGYGVKRPDNVSTFRVPVDALKQLLNPEEGLP